MTTSSVFVLAHERKEFILEALGSIYGQTHPFDKVYVISDTEEIKTKIQEYSTKDNLSYIQLPENECELYCKMSLVNTLVETDVLIFLSDDDLLEKTFLEKAIDKIKTYDVVYSDVELFGLDNRIVSSMDWKIENFQKTTACPFSSLMSKEVINIIKYRNSPFLDWDFWWRACRYGFTGYHIKEPLFKLRTHLGQMSRDLGDINKLNREVINANSQID